jgi:hypothetical protein
MRATIVHVIPDATVSMHSNETVVVVALGADGRQARARYRA